MSSPTIGSRDSVVAPRRRVRCLLFTATLAIVACDRPAATAPPMPLPHADISDATHAGNPLFLFLPPLVAAAPAPVGGVFDATTSPVVDICALATPTSCTAGAPVASYSRTAGAGGELVTVDPIGQAYAVKWKTGSFSLSTAINYRISVRIGAVTLGYADVDIVSDNVAAKVVDPTRYVALINGKTLNIKFAIYRGAADPFPITIDASALSATTMELPAIAFFASTPARTFALRPGAYTLRYYAGGDYGAVSFTVTPSAKVDFDPSLDGALSGRGTATLTVNGYAVGIDATALTAPLLDLTSVVTFPTSSPRAVRVLPGPHQLRYYAGSQDYPSVAVTITTAGKAQYDPALEGVLTGNGTSSLTVRGRTISVDARALTPPELGLLSVTPPFPTSAVKSLTLLPGAYAVIYNAGFPIALSTNFTVDVDGHVDYATQLDGAVDGRGTTALKLNGRAIVVDATELSAPEWFFLSIALFANNAPQTVTLLPGVHYFGYNAGSSFTPPGASITIAPDGHVEYDPALEGILGGRGTSSLVARGSAIVFDGTTLAPSELFLLSMLRFPSSPTTTLKLLPGLHYFGYSAGSPFTPPGVPFTVDGSGNVTYAASLDGAISGRGTRSFSASGRSIQIIIQMAGVTSFNLVQIGNYSSGTTLALLPGIHELIAGTRDITLTVDDAGRIGYDATSFPYLCGAGTSTLIVKDLAC